MAWREYWQRIWQSKGDAIFDDLKHKQDNVQHQAMVTAVEKAATGIDAIDTHIQLLYDLGYMHNHVRMYVASITCNIGQAHWWKPSQWLYYHLLDGDLASNSLSWQWVAGAFSSKKYFCNQENINRYTHSQQQNTFLDAGYDVITKMTIPKILNAHKNPKRSTKLPATKDPTFKNEQPVLVYNSYNLDPKWHSRKNINRILLLEPDHFKQFPVSEKVLQFILDLSANIKNIQVFVGDFKTLKTLTGDRDIIYKLHPTTLHYEGTAESYDELFPQVSGYFPSFSKYWKECLKFLGDRL